MRRRGPPAPQALDRRSVHRLGRGALGIDGRIDLHGSTQEEAHDRLRGYLALVQSNGGRIVLVITGKGKDDGERGVLRRAVPQWLSSPLFRVLVSGYGEAHRTHGGSGALYVRIRKLR
ncbi:MAG: Smr/MutS family protein [Bauldia sp.]